MQTWISVGVLTIFVVFGTQYFLYKNDQLFNDATDIRIDSVRRELTAAKMPPEQVNVIVESMRDMRRDVVSHVRSASSLFWGAGVIVCVLLIDTLFKTRPPRPKSGAQS